jgi:CDP-diacylglycerol--serine O-phosphatidyltransferase
MFSKITHLSEWPYGQVFQPANLLTLTGLASAQLALLSAASGQHAVALILIFLQILIDTVDGHVAKKLHSVSQIGQQLDSFSDLLTIAAVATIIHQIQPASLLLTGASVLLVISAAIRLSVFTAFHQKNHLTFIGLPTTCVSGCLGLFLVSHYVFFPITFLGWVCLLITASGLMVSPLKINRLWQ